MHSFTSVTSLEVVQFCIFLCMDVMGGGGGGGKIFFCVVASMVFRYWNPAHFVGVLASMY